MTELRVQTDYEPRHGWVTVPLLVGGIYSLRLVLDTGSLLSAISEGTRADLAAQGLLVPRGRERWLLRDVLLNDQPVADLPVRLSRRASAVGAPGLLGLDFLSRYSEVCFDFSTMQLTLRQR